MAKKPKQEDDTPPIINVPSLICGEILYETIYMPENSTKFFAYLDPETKAITYTEKVHYRNQMFVPMYEEENRKNVVMLCSEAKPFITIEDVLNRVRDFISKYADLPYEFVQIASYYVLLSYVYDALDQIPYLSFLGDTGTGKSRCKQTIGSLCYLPIQISAGASPAAVYRIIDKWHGTLMIDEADFKSSDETSEMVKLLNCGFEKHSPRIVCDTNDNNKLIFNNPYGPKIIARRFGFSDKALESRCITQLTQETSRRDINKVLPERFHKESQELRNMLLSFRLQYWNKFKNPDLNILDDLGIEPRLQQAFTSIAVVLSHFPEELDMLKAFLRQKQNDIVLERQSTMEGSLILAYNEFKSDLRVLNGTLVITPSFLAREAGDFFGAEISARVVGKILRSLNFVVIPKKISGKTHKVVSINDELFIGLCKRYGVGQGYVVTSVTSVTSLTDTFSLTNPVDKKTKTSASKVYTDQKVPNFSGQGGVQTHSDVTVVTVVTDKIIEIPQKEIVYHYCKECALTKELKWNWEGKLICQECKNNLEQN